MASGGSGEYKGCETVLTCVRKRKTVYLHEDLLYSLYLLLGSFQCVVVSVDIESMIQCAQLVQK